MNFWRFFGYTVLAAVLAAALGGLFGGAVSLVSPEFVRSMFSPPLDAPILRYAVAMGMVWGLFLGAAVMVASLFIDSLHHLAAAISSGRKSS